MLQVKIFEGQSKEDLETQMNEFLRTHANDGIIYTGVKGSSPDWAGYILFKVD